MIVDQYGYITGLDPHEVFVFGSNLAGRHGKGAAKQAREEFGAKYGVGEGPTGQCYAFPTLGHNLEQRPWADLMASRETFFHYAKMRSDKIFVMTKLGVGLAGYPEERMIDMFRWVPTNVVRPIDWVSRVQGFK